MLVANHAHREGWQGGTGWHETGKLCATPCFLELMEGLRRKFQAFEYRDRPAARSVRALWRAMTFELRHSCVFAFKGGVATRMNVHQCGVLFCVAPCRHRR